MKLNIHYLHYFKSSLVLVFFVTSLVGCEPNPSLNEFPQNPCEECNRPPTKPPTPTPIPKTRYEIGYSTGISDANNLFNSTYSEAPCNIGTPIEIKKSNTSAVTIINGINKCFITTLTQKASFYEFIVDYRIALQQKLDQNNDVDFNRGLLNGFNYQISKIAVNYGIGGIANVSGV